MNYTEAQSIWLKVNHVGFSTDLRVARTLEVHTHWGDGRYAWTTEMMSHAGTVQRLQNIADNGLYLRNYYYYPFYILEIVHRY
jgi:hypothetical protein